MAAEEEVGQNATAGKVLRSKVLKRPLEHLVHTLEAVSWVALDGLWLLWCVMGGWGDEFTADPSWVKCPHFRLFGQ